MIGVGKNKQYTNVLNKPLSKGKQEDGQDSGDTKQSTADMTQFVQMRGCYCSQLRDSWVVSWTRGCELEVGITFQRCLIKSCGSSAERVILDEEISFLTAASTWEVEKIQVNTAVCELVRILFSLQLFGHWMNAVLVYYLNKNQNGTLFWMIAGLNWWSLSWSCDVESDTGNDTAFLWCNGWGKHFLYNVESWGSCVFYCSQRRFCGSEQRQLISLVTAGFCCSYYSQLGHLGEGQTGFFGFSQIWTATVLRNDWHRTAAIFSLIVYAAVLLCARRFRKGCFILKVVIIYRQKNQNAAVKQLVSALVCCAKLGFLIILSRVVMIWDSTWVYKSRKSHDVWGWICFLCYAFGPVFYGKFFIPSGDGFALFGQFAFQNHFGRLRCIKDHYLLFGGSGICLAWVGLMQKLCMTYGQQMVSINGLGWINAKALYDL